jgi:nitrate reductase gamma subunit
MILSFLFEIFPYITLSVFVLGTAAVLVFDKYRVTARSGGFLENKKLFWGSVPWHYGIIVILTGHFLGVLVPSAVLSATSDFKMLVALESFAFSAGLLCAFGLTVLLLRKLSDRYALSTAVFSDWLIIILLLFQVITGLYISVFHKWGINWYASNGSAYVISVLKFSPDGGLMTALPLAVKLHVLNMFLMLAVLPFTRLMHIFAVPLKYPFRPHILFRWNR